LFVDALSRTVPMADSKSRHPATARIERSDRFGTRVIASATGRVTRTRVGRSGHSRVPDGGEWVDAEGRVVASTESAYEPNVDPDRATFYELRPGDQVIVRSSYGTRRLVVVSTDRRAGRVPAVDVSSGGTRRRELRGGELADWVDGGIYYQPTIRQQTVPVEFLERIPMGRYSANA
jgi:hypothetical protein